jgi:hypothetical protein
MLLRQSQRSAVELLSAAFCLWSSPSHMQRNGPHRENRQRACRPVREQRVRRLEVICSKARTRNEATLNLDALLDGVIAQIFYCMLLTPQSIGNYACSLVHAFLDESPRYATLDGVAWSYLN